MVKFIAAANKYLCSIFSFFLNAHDNQIRVWFGDKEKNMRNEKSRRKKRNISD